MVDTFPEPFWHLGSYRYPFYGYELRSFFKSSVKGTYLVLDAGCGDKGGYILSMPTNALGVGLDIDRKNIERAVKRSKDLRLHNVSFLVSDIENTPFRKNQFNLIICYDVLEHLKDSEKAIKELAFSLKERGKLLISTTNAFNPTMFIDIKLPKNVIDVVLRRFGVSHYERTYRFNPWNLAEKLRKYGLTVEKLLMFGYPPFGRPWIYEYSKIKPPKMYYFWILFNKLTNVGFLEKFKEVILIVAKKE